MGDGRILEVGHVAVRAGVQRVDDHLRIGGAGDLDAAVEQRLRKFGDAPVAGADVRGVGAEVGERAGVEGGLADAAGGEAFLPARFEACDGAR